MGIFVLVIIKRRVSDDVYDCTFVCVVDRDCWIVLFTEQGRDVLDKVLVTVFFRLNPTNTHTHTANSWFAIQMCVCLKPRLLL